MFATYWLRRNGYCRDHTHEMRQRRRHERLHDDVGRMAKGTIGLQRLTVNVGVSYLNDRGTDDKCAAEESERHPERMMGPLIGAAP